MLTRVFSEVPDVTLFGNETFYPYHPRHDPSDTMEFPNAYAIHHSDVTWKSREDYQRLVRRLRRRLEEQEETNAELERQLSDARGRVEAFGRTRLWRARTRVATAARAVPGLRPSGTHALARRART